MSTGTPGHRYVGAKARAELDIFFEPTNSGEILVVRDRQFLPGAALRGNIFGGIPAWQLFQNLTVTLADHVSYLLV
ncbi:MAG: hypothetical protein WCA55_15395 [Xanthobacteraceae bacterium]